MFLAKDMYLYSHKYIVLTLFIFHRRYNLKRYAYKLIDDI